MEGNGLASSGSLQEQVAVSSEHGREPLASKKLGEILDWEIISFWRIILLRGVRLFGHNSNAAYYAYDFELLEKEVHQFESHSSKNVCRDYSTIVVRNCDRSPTNWRQDSELTIPNRNVQTRGKLLKLQ